jgi:ribosomal protein S18 acetylase RimI-like enzyme
MKSPINLTDITIRTDLRSGDLGYVTYLHGVLYQKEYQYGLSFEAYVAKGLHEFYELYDPSRSRVWVCEHSNKIIGFLLLMDRGNSAQLRYFIIQPEYRGIGLGNHLMNLFMEFLKSSGYTNCYLWTTHELFSAAHLYQKHGFKLSEQVDSSAFGKPLKENKYIVDLQ